GGVNHARVLDLSSLGHTLNDHSYIEGNGVEASSLGYFEDKNIGRYILGAAQMPSHKGNDHILDGWVASLYPLRKSYKCQ
ncbi:MAG: hypothetical protein ACPG05_06000, partial [Bdellovibrionales bacterium]